MILALDQSLALRAGEKVQSQALARTARRRIRHFLQARDRMLLNNNDDDDDDGIVENSRNNKPLMIQEETPSTLYSVSDVVDVLLEYGLNAKDVAEILIHSPGVALMRPRPLVVDNNDDVVLGRPIRLGDPSVL